MIEHWNGRAWSQVRSPNPGHFLGDNTLHGVSATSSSNAWAVGSYTPSFNAADQTLIEHWNARAWRKVPSPDPGGSGNDNNLYGVSATSASNAWAVGAFYNGTGYQTLIEHWNGTAWKHVSSPSPGSLRLPLPR